MNGRRPWPHAPGPGGFTLIELLVAAAVLALLVVMLAQVVTLTGQAISINAKKLDAAGQARLVFDRLANDLAARPRRSDLEMNFTKSSGNDTLQFYSAVSGYTGTRQIAMVGYQIPTAALVAGGPTGQLERGATGTNWTGSNPVEFLQPVTGPANGDYDVLASGVFRFEFCFLNAGTTSSTGTASAGVLSNSPQPSSTDYSGVTAIVVALAILDDNSLKLLSTNQLQTLSADLPDSTEGQDPLSGWTPLLTQSSFAPGIPHQVVQNIRLYQRTFYVP